MFPLRVHSHYSLMRGTASPSSLCRLAKRSGYPGLALTDRDNLYGLWPFLRACKEMGLRPIIGADITDPCSVGSVTALVCNDDGYVNLCRLITRRHVSDHFDLMAEIPQLSKGLFFLCGDMRLLEQWQAAKVQVAADLGPRPTQHGSELRQLAKRIGIKAVVTPDSYVANEDEYEVHRLLRVIKGNSTFSGLDQKDTEVGRHSLAPGQVYKKRFEMWPGVVEASKEIAEQCEFRGPDFGVVMPPWRDAGPEDAGQILRRDSYEGACLRYGEDLPENVVERLEHELAIIDSMGFSTYFLVVRDIVHRGAKGDDREPRRICGRGSGAASLVAYCLKITNVCPVKHNLYFERFLNTERADPPDIDVDFAWDERAQVLKEVFRDYGDRVAMVSNMVCFKLRMAIRETAKAFGLPGAEIAQMTGRICRMLERQDLGSYNNPNRDLLFEGRSFGEPWPEIMRLAEKIVGVPRYLSVHPGGVVITPQPIADYVPLELANTGVRIIQWEKNATEEAGLVKIDLLGNRSLGVIRDCLISVRKDGLEFDEGAWRPEEDELTKANVAKGETMGCFYIESPAMRLLQEKAANGEFDQLVIQSSIIRPAANEFIREYIRRLHGGSYQPLHEKVEDILGETFGLMVYQEDVSRVAVALAGFSHGRANGLRKVLSKKERSLRLSDYKAEFYKGCVENGISLKHIDAIWSMMMSFAGYSFCKPHSASYAMVSYQAAYLKSHFPAKFMAAVISNQGGYYSTFAYVSEAKRMGLKILAPDVNLSSINWQGEDKAIRVGLMAVKGVSLRTIEKIVLGRKHGLYSSCSDFFRRNQAADDEARALILAGAMDCISKGANRPELLYQLAVFRRTMSRGRTQTMFIAELPDPPKLPPQSRRESMRNQYRTLGFLCEFHPIIFHQRQGGGIQVKACELLRHKGRRIGFVGWLLCGKLISTRTGELMEFLTFEDETGQVQATFFPQKYHQFKHILIGERAYLLLGIVEEDYGAVTLTVDSVRLLG